MLLIAIGLGIYFYSGQVSDTTETSLTDSSNPILDTEKKVPDFDLKDLNGVSHTLEQYKGTPLVLNSWAAWCPFCVNELKDFAEVQKDFEGRIVFIAINRAESTHIAKQYTDDLGITDDMLFLIDPTDSFYKSIGGFSMPETLIVNGDGNIVDHKHGSITKNELTNKLNNLLN